MFIGKHPPWRARHGETLGTINPAAPVPKGPFRADFARKPAQNGLPDRKYPQLIDCRAYRRRQIHARRPPNSGPGRTWVRNDWTGAWC